MKSLILSLLAVLVFVIIPSASYAQTCGVPSPETTIHTSAGDVTATLSSSMNNNSLIIRGEVIELWINYYPGMTSPSPYMTVSNGYRRGNPNFVEVSVYNRAHEEPATLNMRQPWSNLWLTTLDLAEELSASQEFWDFISENDDYPEDLRIILSELTSGLYTPYVNYDQFNLRYIYGYQYSIDMMADGYSLGYGDASLDVVTPNGLEDIYILLSAQMPGDRWILHINPGEESASIQYGWGDCSVQIREDDYSPVLASMREVLRFFEGHDFEGLGDLDEFISLAVQGLDYEIEIQYTDRYSEYDMVGPVL